MVILAIFTCFFSWLLASTNSFVSILPYAQTQGFEDWIIFLRNADKSLISSSTSRLCIFSMVFNPKLWIYTLSLVFLFVLFESRIFLCFFLNVARRLTSRFEDAITIGKRHVFIFLNHSLVSVWFYVRFKLRFPSNYGFFLLGFCR